MSNFNSPKSITSEVLTQYSFCIKQYIITFGTGSQNIEPPQILSMYNHQTLEKDVDAQVEKLERM